MTRWLSAPRTWPRSPVGSAVLAIVETLVIGLAIGFADTRNAGDWSDESAYLLAGLVLGFRHAGRAMLCWVPLGGSLYLAHVVAIAHGARPPYVEDNARLAEHCLTIFIPCGLSLMLGALIRTALSAFGWLRVKAGSPVRFLPRSTREILAVVACFGVVLGILVREAFPPTDYAAGFTEARFAKIKVGMATEQVLSILGPPLKKLPWGGMLEIGRVAVGIFPRVLLRGPAIISLPLPLGGRGVG